ncbi:MAG: aspartate carbamoyltransferase regulatory subunit, partial [Clostridia bacterium]|nr:aspartate carbamoyltransferase regulatory subunit [Clostridia bacterium]
MIIGQIKDGIVLDHITAGKGMDIYNILKLGELNCTVAMIKNADSNKMGKKDIIKIFEVIELDLDILGYIDPGI